MFACHAGAAEVQPANEEAEQVEQEKGQAEEEGEKSETNVAAQDIEEVFTKMKEASKGIKSYKISGVTTTTSKMIGVESEEKVEISADIQLELFAQHFVMIGLTDEAEDSEVYVKYLTMYMYTGEIGGWLKMVHGMQDFSMVAVLQENELDHLLTYKDAFQLTEDDNHYIIDFIGVGDMYREVFHDELMAMDNIDPNVKGMLDGIELTGTIKMYVSKDTYLIEKQETYTDSKVFMPIEVTTIDEGVYTITHYNEIGEIVVPNEVIENASEYVNVYRL